MDTLTSIGVFRQVVESGSFVAAADRLDISTAAVSKHVMHVEQRLGVRLLNRNSRTLSLTEPGRVYFERTKAILDDLHETEVELGSQLTAPRGTLRVTAPSFTACQRVADLLAEYRRRHPAVVVDISFEDRTVDLVEEGYDIAMRIAQDAASLPAGLIARPVRTARFVLGASPDYLKRNGTPKTIGDLERHDFVGVAKIDSLPMNGPQGMTEVPIKVVLRYRTAVGVGHAVAAGIGIGPLPVFFFEDPTFKGRLVPVLPEFPLRGGTLYLAYASRKHVPLKIRSFIDFMAAQISGFPDPDLVAPLRMASSMPSSTRLLVRSETSDSTTTLG
jgi:DNA-binding transcriptional LysR family regulator